MSQVNNIHDRIKARQEGKSKMAVKIITPEEAKENGFFTHKQLLLMREALRDTASWSFRKRKMATEIVATLDVILARMKA